MSVNDVGLAARLVLGLVLIGAVALKLWSPTRMRAFLAAEGIPGALVGTTFLAALGIEAAAAAVIMLAPRLVASATAISVFVAFAVVLSVRKSADACGCFGGIATRGAPGGRAVLSRLAFAATGTLILFGGREVHYSVLSIVIAVSALVGLTLFAVDGPRAGKIATEPPPPEPLPVFGQMSRRKLLQGGIGAAIVAVIVPLLPFRPAMGSTGPPCMDYYTLCLACCAGKTGSSLCGRCCNICYNQCVSGVFYCHKNIDCLKCWGHRP